MHELTCHQIKLANMISARQQLFVSRFETADYPVHLLFTDIPNKVTSGVVELFAMDVFTKPPSVSHFPKFSAGL
jgi:hypothetical protein